MYRRQALLIVASLVPAVGAFSALPSVPIPITEPEEDTQKVAETLAQHEYELLQTQRGWKRLKYVNAVRYSEDYTALYCVTRKPKVLNEFAELVEYSMDNWDLPVFGLGKAGRLPGMDDGYNNVTLMLVGTEALKLIPQFDALLAKYPQPKGF